MKLAIQPPLPGELRRLMSLVGFSGLAALGLVAGLMFIRRLAAPTASVSPWLLLGSALLALLLALVLREFAANDAPQRFPAAVAASGAMALSLAAFSVPPTSLAVILILWLMVLGEEVAYWSQWRSGHCWQRPIAPVEPVAPASKGSFEPLLERDDGVDLESEELLPADCLQQLTRSRNEAGGEVIYALLRAEFTQGERQQWLHVAFCPPLPIRPQCTAHFAEGASGVLEVEEVETYGVRLMVRLPQAATSARSVLVEMFAESAGVGDL